MLVTPEQRKRVAATLQRWFVECGFEKQLQLANKAGLAEATVSKILNGKKEASLSRTNVEKIAKAMGKDPTPVLIDLGYVLGGGGTLVPEHVIAMLSEWEPWELEMLPKMRELMHQFRAIAEPERMEIPEVEGPFSVGRQKAGTKS